MLVAIGRRPNTDDLGLDKAGIATDAHGYIQVDDQLRTNVPGIWAMGDCNGRGAFTHTSWNDFEIVAANVLDNEQRRVSDRVTACALYTDPPLGRAGMTEAEVRKTGKPALIATMAMEDVSRAYEKGETKGFMKILVDRDSKQILGASLLGLAGDEVIHCILDLMYAKAPYTVMQRAMANRAARAFSLHDCNRLVPHRARRTGTDRATIVGCDGHRRSGREGGERVAVSEMLESWASLLPQGRKKGKCPWASVPLRPRSSGPGR